MFKYPDLHQYYTRFCHVSDENWHSLEALLKPVEFTKGDVLVRQNHHSPDLFAIRKGVVRTFYTTADGRDVVKIFLTPGQIVSPYIENISGQLPRASSVAVTDVEAVSVPFARLIDALDSSSELMRLHLRLVQSFYMAKEKREYEFLAMDATARYERFLEEFEPFVEQIPNMHIASYVGVTPVSLSRLRRKLREQ